MVLIDVLRIGTAMLDEGMNRVLVRIKDDTLATVALLIDDAVEKAVDVEVLVALTWTGMVVKVVTMREAKEVGKVESTVVVFETGSPTSVDEALTERKVEVKAATLLVVLTGIAEDDNDEVLEVEGLDMVGSVIETVIVSR